MPRGRKGKGGGRGSGDKVKGKEKVRRGTMRWGTVMVRGRRTCGGRGEMSKRGERGKDMSKG